MCVKRDEFEQADGSETTESPRLTLPRQALEIPSLAVKKDQDRIYGEQRHSAFIGHSLGMPVAFVIKPEEYPISRLCSNLIEK